MKVNERAGVVNVERSMSNVNVERSMLRFGGDCGFGNAGVSWGFGGDFFSFRFFSPRDLFLGGLFEIVLVHDAGHVGAGFAKWRHSPVLLDALWTGVIGGERFDQVEVIALPKFAQIAAATGDIGLGIECVSHTQLVGGSGHQLHESAGSFGGNGARV